MDNLDDGAIRSILKQNLSQSLIRRTDAMIIEELGLRHGAARIDVAVIDSALHGFEIKSDRDSLNRLTRQMQVYNAVLDRITLVTGHRLLDRALARVPIWWGIQLAELGDDGVVRLVDVREAQDNPLRDVLAATKLLWKDEALVLLQEIHAADGFLYKPRALIYQRLAEHADPVWLCGRIREQLRCRREWRVAARQRSCDD